MNCTVPFQADDGESLDTFFWIVGLSCALVILTICVMLFGNHSSFQKLAAK